MRFVDLKGKQFGRWQVISRAANARNKMTRWNCVCSCGTAKVVHAIHLTNGVSTKCKSCYHGRYGVPDLEAVVRHRYSGYKSAAKTARRKFELSLDIFRSLCISVCFYCGEPPSTNKHGIRKPKHQKKAPLNGIDRLDNNSGYIESNCVPCCTECNMMKKAKSVQSFISRCISIARYQEEKELPRTNGEMNMTLNPFKTNAGVIQ